MKFKKFLAGKTIGNPLNAIFSLFSLPIHQLCAEFPFQIFKKGT